MENRELFQRAMAIRENAYAPYSHFKVGAALLADSGKVYTGVNVENASFGAAICAERAAVSKAVSEGERGIAAIAVAAGGDGVPYPCGICLQVLAEFGKPGVRIICGTGGDDFEAHTLGELLPHPFHTG